MFKITEINCNFPLNVNFSSQLPCEIYFLAFSLQELVFPCGKEKSLQVEALIFGFLDRPLPIELSSQAGLVASESCSIIKHAFHISLLNHFFITRVHNHN